MWSLLHNGVDKQVKRLQQAKRILSGNALTAVSVRLKNLGCNSIRFALNRRADKTSVFRTAVLGDNPTIALMDGFHVENICSEPELS